MMLLVGHDEAVGQWVADHIPHMAGGSFGAARAVGVLSGGVLLAGVVYNEYHPRYKTMQISIAAESPRWACRGVIRDLLSYPFEVVGVEKLWAATPSRNARALRFNRWVGFHQEGVLERQFGDDDAVMTAMFLEDYEAKYKQAIAA